MRSGPPPPLVVDAVKAILFVNCPLPMETPQKWTKWQASLQQKVGTADSTMVALPHSAPSCNGRAHTRPSLRAEAGLRPAVRREHDADPCPTNTLCRPTPPGVADPWERRGPGGRTVRRHR